MIGSQKQSIEDVVVEVLAENPYCDGVRLVELVKEKMKKSHNPSKEISSKKEVTKQAVYLALKHLIAYEVVSKVAGNYFLSQLWISAINNLFTKTTSDQSDAIFKLSEGESISYKFPSLLTCDTYWAHVFSLLLEWVPVESGVFFALPHQIFEIGRKQVENLIISRSKQLKKHTFYSLLGSTKLDTEYRKSAMSELVSITTNSTTKFPKNYFVCIFADCFIEVSLPEKLSNKIEYFYQEKSKLIAKDIEEFNKFFTEHHEIKMKISRNSKKASTLRKKIAKDFFVPKGIEL